MTPDAVRLDRNEILARVDLERLLDNLSGPAERNRWHCPDPHHPDQHPSVTVRTSTDDVQRWRCWSGGHGGTAIDAVTAAHHTDVGTALRWLADNAANMPLAHRATPKVARPGRPDPAVIDYVEHAAQLLWTAAGEPQRRWLAARGLRRDVLRANRVGADPGRRYLPRPRGMPGGWPAVVYPALTPTGEIAYLQARYLNPPPGRDKYDNPAAALAANPRLAWTVPIGEPRQQLVICEGTADALIAAQAGFRSVGILGATYPDAKIADTIAAAASSGPKANNLSVAICLDADPAGRAGSQRLADLLADRDVETSVITPPATMDLTEWMARDPKCPATLATASEPSTVVLPTQSRPGVTPPSICGLHLLG